MLRKNYGYMDCMFSKEEDGKTMNIIRSDKHDIYSVWMSLIRWRSLLKMISR